MCSGCPATTSRSARLPLATALLLHQGPGWRRAEREPRSAASVAPPLAFVASRWHKQWPAELHFPAAAEPPLRTPPLSALPPPPHCRLQPLLPACLLPRAARLLTQPEGKLKGQPPALSRSCGFHSSSRMLTEWRLLLLLLPPPPPPPPGLLAETLRL